MILLRFLAAIFGTLVLVAAPLFLFSGATPPFFEGWKALAFCLGLAVVASSFFLIAFTGDQMKKSPLLRAVGAGLLAIPFLGCCAVVWRGGDPTQLWASGVVLCFTSLLAIVFIVPSSRHRKHRPMRKREPAEPRLVQVVR